MLLIGLNFNEHQFGCVDDPSFSGSHGKEKKAFCGKMRSRQYCALAMPQLRLFIYWPRTDSTRILEKWFNLWAWWSLFVNLGNNKSAASSVCCRVKCGCGLHALYSLVSSRPSGMLPLLPSQKTARGSLWFSRVTRSGMGRACIFFGLCYRPSN